MMEVTYESVYDGESKPKLCKVVSGASESEKIYTALSVSNFDETSHLSEELIWQHLDNLIEYIKVLAQDLKMVELGMYPNDGWPIINWVKLSTVQEEIMSWWIYVTQRDEPVEVIHNLSVNP